MAKSNLETTLLNAWRNWIENPTRKNSTTVIQAAQPLIDRVISAYLGPAYASDPLFQGKAKLIVIDALQNYSPNKGPITSFLWTHLQRIQRIAGKQRSVLSIPEAIIMDMRKLMSTEEELASELGRPPTLSELADRTGLSERRIEKIKQYQSIGYEGSFEQSQGGSAGSLPALRTKEDAIRKEAIQILYESLDDERDRYIMENAFGLNQKKPKQLSALAKELKMSPATISRRLEKFNNQLAEIQELYNEPDIDVDEE